MIFLSAGHHNSDPGAIGNGTKEALETIKLRDSTVMYLKQLNPNVQVTLDKDFETLGQYLTRIKTGIGSVVLEFHLDASINKTATGSTAIVAKLPSKNSLNFASDLVINTSTILGIKNRGILTEDKTARKSLGLMRKEGIVCLLEVCFISNSNDMKQLKTVVKHNNLCKKIAEILLTYEKLI